MVKIKKKIKEYFGEMGQKDQFWPKTAKFGPKKSNLKFFWAFFKRPKKQFLWQKLRKRLEEMGQKEHFFAKNDQILAKKLKTRIFAQNFFSPFFKRPKNQFLWQKSEKNKVAFGRNGLKRAFLAKTTKFWPKTAKKLKPRIFARNFFSPFLKTNK